MMRLRLMLVALVVLVATSVIAQEYNVAFRRPASPLAYDAVSSANTFDANVSWTHTPVGTPKGVIVFCGGNGDSTDSFTGATYGGVAMTQIANAADTVTEPSFTEGYFLGSGIPTGAQTVVCTYVGALGIDTVGAAYTFTAGGNTSTAGAGSCTVSNNVANPSCTIGSQTTPTIAAGMLMSGVASTASITAGSGYTKTNIFTTGTQSVVSEKMDAEQASGTVTVNFTVVTDDVSMVGIAIKQ